MKLRALKMELSKNKELNNLQLRIGDEYIYLDVDEFLSRIELKATSKTKDQGINLPKFEFFKLMIDTVCTITEEVDESMGTYGLNKISLPYKLAFNTLLKYKILKKLN